MKSIGGGEIIACFALDIGERAVAIGVVEVVDVGADFGRREAALEERDQPPVAADVELFGLFLHGREGQREEDFVTQALFGADSRRRLSSQILALPARQAVGIMHGAVAAGVLTPFIFFPASSSRPVPEARCRGPCGHSSRRVGLDRLCGPT